MAFIDLKIYSESLRMETNVLVVLPQAGTRGQIGVTNGRASTGKLKCLYLLHGLTDNQTIWTRRTSIERYASKYGIAVVMPDGARSFYTDMKHGEKYYTYITKELPSIIEGMLCVSDKREDRYIGGNSMGGYGAFKSALTEHGRYAAAFALSPLSDIRNPIFENDILPAFGATVPDEADLFALSAVHKSDSIRPRLYIAVGRDDYMYNDTLRLDGHLRSLGYDYTYAETDGAHNWELWDNAVSTAIEWMLEEKA